MTSAGLLLAACTGGSSNAKGSTNSAGDTAKGVLTVGVPSPLGSLDPAKDGYNVQSIMRFLSNEPLTIIDPSSGEVKPGLAASWRYVGTGNKTFELSLRKDARFSDGTSLDSAAVKAWIEYFLNAKGPFAGQLDLASIETPDQWTVQVNLKSPNPGLPWFFSNNNIGFVSGPKALANPSTLGTQTDGVGPYELDASQTVAGDHYTFVPNKYYYDQKDIHFSKVVVKVISNPATMLQAAQSGQLDVAIGDPTTGAAAESAGLSVLTGPAGAVWMSFKDFSGPLGDVRVRQALNYAIDRKAITTAMVGKFGTPTSEWALVDASDPNYQNYYSYDPQKAKSLLVAAGYPNGFTFTMLDEGYSGNLGDPAVQAVAKYLGDVGVKMKITTVSNSGAFLSGLGGNYDAFVHEWGSAPLLVIYPTLLKPGGLVTPKGYSDSTIESLVAQGQVASGSGEQYWKQVTARTVTQAYFLPMFTFDQIVYASNKMSGIKVTQWFLFSNNITEWTRK